ncbi:heme-binding protein [Paraburkholderia bonniea]|uniref:GlcG/HbpS family heme-binding protein n=1 Tax=Paraburkholderia bonniea TaxID=2152891 RepID=UPI001291B691|nr:heme-binding protein [Paraburkholderia bonniea]WJF91104.1 heme-binding protein [Paraburkholderia bonniea]WJF94419.1 heme-binding protein [Paraburkholderia bonniea]
MKTKLVLTDSDVKKMASAAEAHAVSNQWNVTITIFDDGGHLLYLHRMDNVAPSTVEMAMGKGRTAVLGRRESKVYEEIVQQGRISFLSAPLSAMVEGGVPIVVEGAVVGAIGVSGVKSDQDAAIARAGIAALGMA